MNGKENTASWIVRGTFCALAKYLSKLSPVVHWKVDPMLTKVAIGEEVGKLNFNSLHWLLISLFGEVL